MLIVSSNGMLVYRLKLSKLHIKGTDDNDINLSTIQLMSLSSVPFMCSFDIVSLYTKILLRSFE